VSGPGDETAMGAPGLDAAGAPGRARGPVPFGAALGMLLPAPWPLTLRAAGLTGARLRRDHTAAARVVARRYPGLYPLTRLLLPPVWQPPYFAVSAFGIHADSLVDQPAGRGDPGRIHAWADEVRHALATGRPERPFLRAFVHTVRVHRISHRDVHTYLAGQAQRLGLAGYVTERDHDDHIDHVVLPLARMAHSVIHPPEVPPDEPVLRAVGDAVQRVDDLADLAADLRRGFLTIPQSDLLAFGVTRTDLERGHGTEPVRALLAHVRHRAAVAVEAALGALSRTDRATQLLYRMWLMGCRITLTGVERRGTDLTRRGVVRQVRPSPADLLDTAAHTVRTRFRLATAQAAGSPAAPPTRPLESPEGP
jgi:15-cis-phytoene synthase